MSTENHTTSDLAEGFSVVGDGDRLYNAMKRIRVMADFMQSRPDDGPGLELANNTVPDAGFVIYNDILEVERIVDMLLGEWQQLRQPAPHHQEAASA
ncbi:MAG: hypothetical protein AB1450_11510 [Pseudomonadota bacterium]